MTLIIPESYLPAKALSVRQPWAWAIVHGGKDIENRDWRHSPDSMRFRGDFCVHASTGMTRYEYESAAEFMAKIGVTCPPPADLKRGGIIGIARLVDIVKDSDSPWFFGRIGLVLEDARSLDFIPAGGALGFFSWKRAEDDYPPKPAKWMLAADNRPTEPEIAAEIATGDLFAGKD